MGGALFQLVATLAALVGIEVGERITQPQLGLQAPMTAQNPMVTVAQPHSPFITLHALVFQLGPQAERQVHPSGVKPRVRSISQSPRRLRAKYTHRTNFVYALCISPLQGAIIAGNGSKFVNGCRCIHSQMIWQNLFCRRQGGSAYRKKFIYSNDKIKQYKRQDHLYIQSCKTGKSLCGL